MIPQSYKERAAQAPEQWNMRRSQVPRLLKALKEHRITLSDKTIADAGCNLGRDSALLAKHAKKVIGIDSDGNSIKDAMQINVNVKNLTFANANADYIYFLERSSIDGLYCVNTLFYTYVSKSLPELQRVVKPMGWLFITLDERITDLDKDEVIHSSDVLRDLRYLDQSKVLQMTYREREDQVPFRHKHQYYEILLRKEVKR